MRGITIRYLGRSDLAGRCHFQRLALTLSEPRNQQINCRLATPQSRGLFDADASVPETNLGLVPLMSFRILHKTANAQPPCCGSFSASALALPKGTTKSNLPKTQCSLAHCLLPGGLIDRGHDLFAGTAESPPCSMRCSTGCQSSTFSAASAAGIRGNIRSMSCSAYMCGSTVSSCTSAS